MNGDIYEIIENLDRCVAIAGRLGFDSLRESLIQSRDEAEALRDKWECGECEEFRYDDARVEAGMKCGFCAYGG